jgi:hypothetical protein
MLFFHKNYPQKKVEMWTNSKNPLIKGFFLIPQKKVFHRLCKTSHGDASKKFFKRYCFFQKKGL